MKNTFILLITILSLPLQAQKLKQILLPDHKGFRIKSYQESRYGFIYVTRDNQIYMISGEQIKNPNKITEGLKNSKNGVDRAYIFADNKTPYSTIDKINTVIARSGIENICYMMTFPGGSRAPFGYLKKLYNHNIVNDRVKEKIKENRNKVLDHTQMIITSGDHKIELKDGKKIAIESRAYREMINASVVISVGYMDDISYGDYIYWLDKTQRIIKKQRYRKRKKTLINELSKELMKYNHD
ncbi:hypothetical protein ACWGOQ_0019120 [Aquimarina sp. M1]